MEEKTIQRIKKLQALAERGVGGEKETAAKMLQRLLEKNGISTLEELEKDEAEYFLFSYKGKHEIKLLKQCMYKVLGYSDHTKYYRTRGTRQKIGIYCTKAQRIEIELEFEFYRNVFYEELPSFMDAFIQAQGIGTQKARQTMRRRRRENQILKGLIRAAVAVAICIAGLILFFVFIWWQAQQAERTTDEEAAALMQRQQAEPLVIETPEPATEGSIRVYDYDGCCIYAYYGEIKINSDGRDGKQIDIECAGYLEGYQQHGVHESEVRE